MSILLTISIIRTYRLINFYIVNSNKYRLSKKRKITAFYDTKEIITRVLKKKHKTFYYFTFIAALIV